MAHRKSTCPNSSITRPLVIGGRLAPNADHVSVLRRNERCQRVLGVRRVQRRLGKPQRIFRFLGLNRFLQQFVHFSLKVTHRVLAPNMPVIGFYKRPTDASRLLGSPSYFCENASGQPLRITIVTIRDLSQRRS